MVLEVMDRPWPGLGGPTATHQVSKPHHSPLDSVVQYLAVVCVVMIDSTYFSSHYYLGHRKFETGDPEVFLFGDMMDLNYLPPKPVKVSSVNQTTVLVVIRPATSLIDTLSVHIVPI